MTLQSRLDTSSVSSSVRRPGGSLRRVSTCWVQLQAEDGKVTMTAQTSDQAQCQMRVSPCRIRAQLISAQPNQRWHCSLTPQCHCDSQFDALLRHSLKVARLLESASEQSKLRVPRRRVGQRRQGQRREGRRQRRGRVDSTAAQCGGEARAERTGTPGGEVASGWSGRCRCVECASVRRDGCARRRQRQTASGCGDCGSSCVRQCASSGHSCGECALHSHATAGPSTGCCGCDHHGRVVCADELGRSRARLSQVNPLAFS